MKKILLFSILLSLFSIVGYSQATTGTRITSTIVPNDESDPIATTDSKYVKGGFHQVSRITERDSILPARRTEGMFVYVKADSIVYQLRGGITNSNWVNAYKDITGITPTIQAYNDTIIGGVVIFSKIDVDTFNFQGHTLTYSWTGPNGYTSNTKSDAFIAGGLYTVIVTDVNTSKQYKSVTNVYYLDITGGISTVNTTAPILGDGSLGSHVRLDPTTLDTIRQKVRQITPTAVKTTTYNALAYDFVPCDNTSASFTVNLPNSPEDKTRLGVKLVIQGGSNTITIASAGSDVFNKTSGATTLTLQLLNQATLLQYAKSTGIWHVLSTDAPLSGLDTRYSSRITGQYRYHSSDSIRLDYAMAYYKTDTCTSDSTFAIKKLTSTVGSMSVITVKGDGTHTIRVLYGSIDITATNMDPNSNLFDKNKKNRIVIWRDEENVWYSITNLY